MQFDGVHPQCRHNVLRTSMVFPRTESLELSKPVMRVKYKCDGPRCDFVSAMTAITKNQDFQAWDVAKMLTTIVEDISNHTDDYNPDLYDGFHVNLNGQDLLRLEREGAQGNGRTGFLDYNLARRDLLEIHRTDRIVSAVCTSVEKTEARQPLCSIM